MGSRNLTKYINIILISSQYFFNVILFQQRPQSVLATWHHPSLLQERGMLNQIMLRTRGSETTMTSGSAVSGTEDSHQAGQNQVSKQAYQCNENIISTYSQFRLNAWIQANPDQVQMLQRMELESEP